MLVLIVQHIEFLGEKEKYLWKVKIELPVVLKIMTEACIKKLLLIVLLYSSFSLFAIEHHIENRIYKVPQTLTHGFESVYISGNSNAVDDKSQEETETFIYVEGNVIFTAPDYVLNNVVYGRHVVKKNVREKCSRIALHFEKVFVRQQATNLKHKNICSFTDVPDKDSSSIKGSVLISTVTNVNNFIFNVPFKQAEFKKSIFVLSEGVKSFFFLNTVLHCNPDRQNFTTRPPPFSLCLINVLVGNNKL